MSLTGEPFNAKYLADRCNQSVEQAWQAARTKMQAADERSYPHAIQSSLDAVIRIVHGDELIAENSKSDADMCAQFERWVEARYPVTVR